MKILSIDGGGVRGIIPARILQTIEEKTGKYTSQLFDIVSGTSTGGLVSLALTTPEKEDKMKPNSEKKKPAFSAKYIVDFYLNRAKEIFPASSWFGSLKGVLNLQKSKYDRKAYDNILAEVFQDTLLSQTLCPAFIPIYSLDNNKPFIACTLCAKDKENNDFYLRDIAAATSAAPTYFDPKTFTSINNGVTYQGVDGGIYANNPELLGVLGAYQSNPSDFAKQNVLLLSLGTGEVITKKVNKGNNGGLGWLFGKDIIGSMMDADSLVAEAAIKAVLKDENNFRFQVGLKKEEAIMDNSNEQNLDNLLKIAEKFVKANEETIDDLCKKLTT